MVPESSKRYGIRLEEHSTLLYPPLQMRALLIVLDSVGCGHAPDAAAYHDSGANTLGHIFERFPTLSLPHLFSLGLSKILTSDVFDPRPGNTRAGFGRMRPKSAGKDSTTGHWEIAGVVLDKPFATFQAFPEALIDAIRAETGVSFIGNAPRSGTLILEELGRSHLETVQLILYTSADSVLQIAAHEEVMSARQLHSVCRVARRHADAWRIGRVIARPFRGKPGAFERTKDRHDFSITPPRTILNALADRGLRVQSVGKVGDLFAGSGITHLCPTASNADGMEAIETLWPSIEEGLIFANLVDFDTLYGHRRDIQGYAEALSAFDQWLGRFLPLIEPEDLVILTADHGNDPAFRGTDHTREEVPLLVMHQEASAPLGTRKTFADIGVSLLDFFGIPEKWPTGTSFLRNSRREPQRPTSDEASPANATSDTATAAAT
jgi:phosphopentomutase